jgi:predicted TIM-barrel fold metal-dependent hydrolase
LSPRGSVLTIYDAHIHIPGGRGEVFHEVGDRIRTMPQLLGIMDECGIDKGVIFSTVGTLSTSAEAFVRGNQEVFRSVEDHPGRFWGACTVNPLFLEESLEELRRCRLDLGFPWLGEMCPYLGGYSATSRQMLEVIAEASDLGYVVHMHCSNAEARVILREFAETTFVFAHLQSFSDCRERFEIAAQREGIYVDISGSEIVRHGILELAIEIAGPGKLLFGSDLIIDKPVPTIARVEALKISRADKDAIFWRNLSEILDNPSSSPRFIASGP